MSGGLRGALLCDFWVKGKPTALARPRATLMFTDAYGKRRSWQQHDTTPRLRKNIFIAMFTPEKQKGMRPTIPVLARQSLRRTSQNFKEIECPVVVDLAFVFAPNVSDTKKVKHDKSQNIIPHIKKPDIDNINKMVLDAMTGVVFKDDTQVISQTMFKVFGPQSGVRIRIYEAEINAMPDTLDYYFPNGLSDEKVSGPLL